MTGGMEVKEIKLICPNCGSENFSISCNKSGASRPSHWGEDVLGLSDCHNCQQGFLVRLAPEFRRSIENMTTSLGLVDANDLIKTLFGV